MKVSKDRTIHSETTVWRQEDEGTRRINVNNLLDRVKKEKLQNIIDMNFNRTKLINIDERK